MVGIRRGEPGDEARLREIQAATLAEPWPELLSAALGGAPPIYVAVGPADEPLGYAIVVPDSESVAYLPELAVDPGRQGEGIGSELLDGVADRFPTHDELRLTVRAIDEEARSFYRENGFERRERLPGHFEESDGFLLVREL